jgi:hypothetical protein
MLEFCKAIAEEQVRAGLELLSSPHISKSFSFTRCARSEKWEVIDHNQGITCPFHEPQLRRASIEAADQTILDFLKRTGAQSVVLDWPICVEADCSDCFAVHQPLCRVAVLSRRWQCPHCGSINVRPAEVLHEINRRNQWSRIPLADLGIPSEHMLMIK